MEASLSRAVSVHPDRPKWAVDEHLQPHVYGTVPPHFYRELTRTVEGCKLLKDSGHFGEFVATIQESWAEAENREIILKVKGCLWAVGNIGSMELGASFLEETDVVPWIVKITAHSEAMTMRGTAFFVLGLISRSLHGMEILAEHGWNAATDELGRSLGYCLPPHLGVIFSVSHMGIFGLELPYLIFHCRWTLAPSQSLLGNSGHDECRQEASRLLMMILSRPASSIWSPIWGTLCSRKEQQATSIRKPQLAFIGPDFSLLCRDLTHE